MTRATNTRELPTKVGNVEVISAEPALSEDHRPGAPEGRKVTLQTVLHVLLANDVTGYLCFHPNAPECEQMYGSPRSTLAHQRSHGDRMVAKRAQAELDKVKAEKEAAEAELATRKEKASDRSRKAWESRRANRKLAQAESADPATPTPPLSAAHALADAIQSDLDLAYEGLTDVKTALAKTTVALDRIEERVQELRKIRSEVDPIILEKAKRYDAFTAPLNQPIK